MQPQREFNRRERGEHGYQRMVLQYEYECSPCLSYSVQQAREGLAQGSYAQKAGYVPIYDVPPSLEDRRKKTLR